MCYPHMYIYLHSTYKYVYTYTYICIYGHYFSQVINNNNQNFSLFELFFSCDGLIHFICPLFEGSRIREVLWIPG